jgi:alanyl-tRNA synthetase
MQYEQHPDGRRTELPFKSVDTGMGLERLASVSQQVLSNYDTDLFLPIHAAMRKITKHSMAEFDAQRFSYDCRPLARRYLLARRRRATRE